MGNEHEKKKLLTRVLESGHTYSILPMILKYAKKKCLGLNISPPSNVPKNPK